MSETSNEHTTKGRTGGLTTSERHELLASERRRVTIEVLADRAAPVDLREIAGEVAAREVGVDGSDEATRRVALTLHHTHLPKMADLGVLEYDPDLNRVESIGTLVGHVRA